jgi:ATP-binding cassette subfamily C protein LapB
MIQIVQAKVAAEGLDALIKLPNEIDDQVHAMIPGHIEGGLRFDQVRFDYGNRDLVALDIPKLEIKPGEIVGVLGSIGSGKSTLTKLASGLYRPSDGNIFFGGLDMAQLANQVLRENIAYLPQDFRLISGTLRDNLQLGLPDHGDEAILEMARKTGLIDLIAKHPKGLALPITEGGSGVSGGQRQLIGLTRMMLSKSSVYILDEPTASMDSATEATVVALLSNLAASGVTMLVSTHKTALLPMVSRLLVMHGGVGCRYPATWCWRICQGNNCCGVSKPTARTSITKI